MEKRDVKFREQVTVRKDHLLLRMTYGGEMNIQLPDSIPYVHPPVQGVFSDDVALLAYEPMPPDSKRPRLNADMDVLEEAPPALSLDTGRWLDPYNT